MTDVIIYVKKKLFKNLILRIQKVNAIAPWYVALEM